MFTTTRVTLVVVDRDGEHDSPTLDLLDGGFGGDGLADSGRGEVIDLDLHGHGGLAGIELRSYGGEGCLLA